MTLAQRAEKCAETIHSPLDRELREQIILAELQAVDKAAREEERERSRLSPELTQAVNAWMDAERQFAEAVYSDVNDGGYISRNANADQARTAARFEVEKWVQHDSAIRARGDGG